MNTTILLKRYFLKVSFAATIFNQNKIKIFLSCNCKHHIYPCCHIHSIEVRLSVTKFYFSLFHTIVFNEMTSLKCDKVMRSDWWVGFVSKRKKNNFHLISKKTSVILREKLYPSQTILCLHLRNGNFILKLQRGITKLSDKIVQDNFRWKLKLQFSGTMLLQIYI